MSKFIKNEFNENGTQVVVHDVIKDSKTLRLVVVGKVITDKDLDKIKKTMAHYQLNNYTLKVIQGSQSDSLMMIGKYMNMIDNQTNYTQIIQNQEGRIKSLEDNLHGYVKYEKMSQTLSPQLKILFPEIHTITLQRVVQASTDTTKIYSYVIAVVGLYDKKQLKKNEMDKFSKWIKTYVSSDSIRIIATPQLK